MKEERSKSLTKAELNLMNILWDKGKATVNELVEALPEPKPAYTTVLTVMQVLTKKQVLTFEKQGKANVYIPLLSREEYLNNGVSQQLHGRDARQLVQRFSEIVPLVLRQARED